MSEITRVFRSTGLDKGQFSEVPLSYGHYPDGMPVYNKTDKWFEGATVDALMVRPKSMDSFTTALFYADAEAERGRRIKTLILPFVPGSRQDRLNPAGDQLFTLKSVARMINDRKFDKVVVLDPHSYVTPALIDRCDVYPLPRLFEDHRYPAKYVTTTATGNVIVTEKLEGRAWKRDYDAVIAPDAGASKRAFEVAQALGVEFVQGEKHRDVSTGKLSGFNVPGLLNDKGEYLVVDDICDGGGTFVGLLDAARRYESQQFDLFVTHGIFSKGVEALSGFRQVSTTDSTLFNHTGAYTHNITKELYKWSL